MKKTFRRSLIPALLLLGALGILNASGQTYIVADSGTLLAAPVRIQPIGPEPQPKAPTPPAPPSAPTKPVVPVNPVTPSQPILPPNHVPIGPEPEPKHPPLL